MLPMLSVESKQIVKRLILLSAPVAVLLALLGSNWQGLKESKPGSHTAATSTANTYSSKSTANASLNEEPVTYITTETLENLAVMVSQQQQGIDQQQREKRGLANQSTVTKDTIQQETYQDTYDELPDINNVVHFRDVQRLLATFTAMPASSL